MRYALEEGDFAVLAGVSDEGEEVVLTGALAHVHAGESVDVSGDWRRHPRHGPQFAVERVRVREPRGEAAVLAYLNSIKHVGIRGAAWLVDRHGVEGVLDAVDRDPHRALREVPGIGERKIGPAVRSWEEQGALRAVRLFLEGHGVPAAAAARIYRALGPGSIEMLQTDPYATTEVEGIGFATADALARALGTPPDAPARIAAGCSTRSTRPRATATATSRARRSSPAPGGCSGPTPRIASTSWPPRGSSSRRTGASRTR